MALTDALDISWVVFEVVRVHTFLDLFNFLLVEDVAPNGEVKHVLCRTDLVELLQENILRQLDVLIVFALLESFDIEVEFLLFFGILAILQLSIEVPLQVVDLAPELLEKHHSAQNFCLVDFADEPLHVGYIAIELQEAINYFTRVSILEQEPLDGLVALLNSDVSERISIEREVSDSVLVDSLVEVIAILFIETLTESVLELNGKKQLVEVETVLVVPKLEVGTILSYHFLGLDH